MPPIPPPPDRLPTYLRDAVLLRAVSRLGLAMPEQIAAVIVGHPVPDISTADSLRVERRLDAISRRGLLNRGTWRTWYRALRDHERSLYRLTAAGVDALDNSTGARRRALLAIHASSSQLLDGWSDERTIWFASYPLVSDQRVFRAHLTRLVRSGEAERWATRRTHHVPAYSLTTEGIDAVRRADAESGGSRATDPWRVGYPAATRTPRPDQAVHHLLVVSAIAVVLRAARATFILLRGDEDLRSEARAGRPNPKGERLAGIPDGRLWFGRAGESSARTLDIEVLIGKYTDEQIARKHCDLSPQTLFFAPTEELCRRVEQSGRRRPTLIF